ncbi:MAG TPA: phosphonate metabolism transcriptional regulator PhnF [Coleofasciculaceae cyanobacterium]|jgi:GntR family phosphonate transport system transcriptional regulator
MNHSENPVYVQIANELRQNINDGIYKPGDKLPTEEQLSLRFSVNRHTLRRAISLLKAEGLLRVDQGRGTFVANALIRYPIGKRVRYNETLKAQGHEASFKLVRSLKIPAESAVASSLEIKVGTPVALMERLSLADGQPISIATSYFPLSLFPDILIHCQQICSISKMLGDIYNCDHIRRVTRISARMVKRQDAPLLELPLNHPILLAESVNVDQHGRVIEYGVARFRGDRMELVFENAL